MGQSPPGERLHFSCYSRNTSHFYETQSFITVITINHQMFPIQKHMNPAQELAR